MMLTFYYFLDSQLFVRRQLFLIFWIKQAALILDDNFQAMFYFQTYGSGITFAIFSLLGTKDVLSDKFMMCVKGFAMTSAQSFSSLGGRLSVFGRFCRDFS